MVARIHIIEDNRFYASLIAEKIRKAFPLCEIHIFDSCTKGVHAMALQPDLIFLDYHLPDGNGLSCLHQLKEINPNQKIIMLSAQEDMEVAIGSLKSGALDYVIKGVDDTVENFKRTLEIYLKGLQHEKVGLKERFKAFLKPE